MMRHKAAAMAQTDVEASVGACITAAMHVVRVAAVCVQAAEEGALSLSWLPVLLSCGDAGAAPCLVPLTTT
jgi:hypothetical protein